MDEDASAGIDFRELLHPVEGDRRLLDAIANALPEKRRAAFAPLARAWEAAVDERLHRAMRAVAGHVLDAARQVETVPKEPLWILTASGREELARARREAMERIVARLDGSAQALAAQLRRLHGVDDAAEQDIQHGLEDRLRERQSVDAGKAALAGAASGAAAGASIDLLVGGITLGAAAALGALVGGGGAWIGAIWKNGETQVQLSDAMLGAITEAALLRYVAISYWARGHRSVDERWPGEVVAAVQGRADFLASCWKRARSGSAADEKLADSVARELEDKTRTVFRQSSQSRP
jgi:hypothetical protein